MTEENKEGKEMDINEVVKKQQMQILERLGSGGLNQNDLMALWGMMGKQEQPNTFGEMMPMIMAMKMLNPSPKQDPMLTMMLLQSMKRDDGGGEVNKKIEKLEEMIKAKEDKKMYEDVMSEIKDLQKNREQVGFKDVLGVLSDKDKIINDIKLIANDKDRELLMTTFQNSIKGLQDEIKNMQGGDIGRVSQTIKEIKGIYTDLGLEKAGQKSKEEVITDLVRSVSDSLAPGINAYMQRMSEQPQQAPQLTPEQMKKLQEIKAQRAGQQPPENPGPQGTENPSEQPSESKPAESYRDEDGDRVYPDLIQISESGAKRRRK